MLSNAPTPRPYMAKSAFPSYRSTTFRTQLAAISGAASKIQQP